MCANSISALLTDHWYLLLKCYERSLCDSRSWLEKSFGQVSRITPIKEFRMSIRDKIDRDAIDAILSTPEEDFVILASAAGLDPESDFIGADLRNVEFGNCDLTGFNFSEADLTGADLSKAKIDGACFNDAKGLDTAKLPN
jgi:uncharacterized protein YjbI with pentapeptide repeats